jgi:hypothetical protein
MTIWRRQITTAGVILLVTAPWLHGQTSEGVREFTLSPKTVQTVHGKLGFTSVIVLPPDEPIAETVIGDTAGWFVEDSGNVIKITMLKAGAESNVNVVMADNRIYTFLLREIGKGEKPDFQLIAKTDRAPGESRTRFIPLTDHEAAVTALQAEVDSMKTAVTQAKADADQRVREQVAAFARQYPQQLRAYQTEALRVAPFFVQQVWGDDTSTWIRLKADELPAVYERLDGHPAILNPIALPGEKPGLMTIQIPKHVAQGYLKVGKAEWKFVAADAAGTR